MVYVTVSTILNGLFVTGFVLAVIAFHRDRAVAEDMLGRHTDDMTVRYSRNGILIAESLNAPTNRLVVSCRPQMKVVLGEWFNESDDPYSTNELATIAVCSKNFVVRWSYDCQTNCSSVVIGYNQQRAYLDRNGQDGLKPCASPPQVDFGAFDP